MNKAKAEYDQMDPDTRGSPQPYRLIAALVEMGTDEEIPEDTRHILQEFLEHMEKLDEPAKWERYVTVFRSAGTRDKAVLKLHCQVTLITISEFPELISALRLGLEKRGWNPKDATAPTSQSFKAVIKTVNQHRSWG
jgi:hypothetical protein